MPDHRAWDIKECSVMYGMRDVIEKTAAPVRTTGKTIRQICRDGYYDLRLRTLMTGVLALAWWGILYPELCFTDGTYEKVTASEELADEAENENRRGDSGADGEAEREEAYDGSADILRAKPGEIVIKSRLLEWLAQKIK